MKTNNKKAANKKPTYRKQKKPSVISTQDRIKKIEKKMEQNAEVTPFHPVIVPPSEKYADTIRYIKQKKFFIDAATGMKVYLDSIKEFHVDKNDVPVLLCKIVFKDRDDKPKAPQTKVYRIIRYNSDEIVGLNSKNTNIWVLNNVNVTSILEESNIRKQKRSF